MDGQPVGHERGGELPGGGVDDRFRQPEQHHHRAEHEHAEPVGAIPQHEHDEEDHRDAGDRGDELVHVAPRHPVHGEPAADHADDMRRQPGYGQRHGRPDPPAHRPGALPPGGDSTRIARTGTGSGPGACCGTFGGAG
ncbi:MAG TPA: hypothetical protein VE343_15405, partial [Streptosporangiaceae bacterium]|nr:hypothetical protein [Streptosporangiaceae bacterium]